MQLTQHTFDPWEVAVQIDGLPFTDFGTGDKVAVAWNNDNVTDSVDNNGNGKSAINHDHSGTFTFSIDPNAANYAHLIDLANNLTGVPVSVTSNFAHFHTDSARITRPVDTTLNAEYPSVSVVFKASVLQVDPVTTA
ncbi:hypothetical protein [Lentilactobacillus hilgardii]|uniref:hypothetical protein n=1 Tax=Lentilactobacillus hilgardii TaxID=1588 RepID=UPI0021A5F603|nr:hypothetical protein [Lentilactobacillus hilgardii]MCT3396913.1 hypothetical protein [Lentilactobacillus hilgardii]